MVTTTTDRQAIANELVQLEEEHRNEVADLERQAVDLEHQVVDLQAALKEAVNAHSLAAMEVSTLRSRFDTRRSRLEHALRATAPAGIVAFREAAMARLDRLALSRGDVSVRGVRSEAIRVALRELPALELEVDEGAVEARLRELGAAIGGDEHA